MSKWQFWKSTPIKLTEFSQEDFDTVKFKCRIAIIYNNVQQSVLIRFF